MKGRIVATLVLILAAALAVNVTAVLGGETQHNTRLRILPGITHKNLTIYPVVSGEAHDTTGFLTLDEGLQSGKVEVVEAGRLGRIWRGDRRTRPAGGDEVNRLVLLNKSGKPLLLLAGEIVTGGKQDRMVARDRIVPADEEPVDLSVFCVEPGRWTEVSANFGSFKSQMALPNVRAKSMKEKDQQLVWNSVGESNRGSLAYSIPVPTEAGLFRSAEIKGEGFHAYRLESLLKGTEFEVHAAKIADNR